MIKKNNQIQVHAYDTENTRVLGLRNILNMKMYLYTKRRHQKILFLIK